MVGPVRRDLQELLGPRPLVLAPMAGGPTGVALVAAVAEAGGLGLLPAGYRSAAQLAADLEELRARGVSRFGVNLFVPQGPCPDRQALDAYLAALRPEAERLGVELGEPRHDDDDWEAKLALLLAEPPPLVSFVFGCPPAEVVDAFHQAGCLVVVTVTRPDEAREAVAAGADGLCAQGLEAGGHRGGTRDDLDGQLPLLDLLGALRGVTDLPLLAAGGLGSAAATQRALRAGALACQCGTAFLLADEAGTSDAHRQALQTGRFPTTVLTRAFTGRFARGLANRLALAGRDAPGCYPEIHHATRPLRQAAAARGDLEVLHLWAGTAFPLAEARPAGEIVERLCPAG
jgi:nitronate monooxygenase